MTLSLWVSRDNKMRIFISWSGERSQGLALALHDWLKTILGNIEPWMSKEDIDLGTRWSQSIADELDKANFGVICLTKENMTAPWLLFEAGALTKSVGASQAIPLLFEMEQRDLPSASPLSQIQGEKFEKDGLLRVIKTISKASKDSREDRQIEELFEAMWPKLNEKIRQIPPVATPKNLPHRTNEVVLEELVENVRSIEGRLNSMATTLAIQAKFSQQIAQSVANPAIRTFPSLIGGARKTLTGFAQDPRESEVLEDDNQSEYKQNPWEKYEKSDPRSDESDT